MKTPKYSVFTVFAVWPTPRFADFICGGLAGPARARQGTVGHGGRCGKLVQTHFKGGFRG